MLNDKNKCLECSKYINKRNKFCNSSCSAIYNNKKRSINKKYNKCLNCGNDTKNIKYCSISCSNEYKIKNRNIDVLSGKASHKRCKKYLIEKYGNKCLDKDCAWDFSKSSVNVELEHIDGNSLNNNINNITLLCPNCHSKTDTYKSKNKGQGRHFRRARYKSGLSY